jgi:hypothetical protein
MPEQVLDVGLEELPRRLWPNAVLEELDAELYHALAEPGVIPDLVLDLSVNVSRVSRSANVDKNGRGAPQVCFQDLWCEMLLEMRRKWRVLPLICSQVAWSSVTRVKAVELCAEEKKSDSILWTVGSEKMKMKINRRCSRPISSPSTKKTSPGPQGPRAALLGKCPFRRPATAESPTRRSKAGTAGAA